jgi:hypothetical protein
LEMVKWVDFQGDSGYYGASNQRTPQ